eukprot:augustus_masked-scaffold_12-processed-gene-4.8-mRNA-1 protein AED:0.42 eAED:0.42 QI:0/-1/0/1/-1/1/1/0/632
MEDSLKRREERMRRRRDVIELQYKRIQSGECVEPSDAGPTGQEEVKQQDEVTLDQLVHDTQEFTPNLTRNFVKEVKQMEEIDLSSERFAEAIIPDFLKVVSNEDQERERCLVKVQNFLNEIEEKNLDQGDPIDFKRMISEFLRDLGKETEKKQMLIEGWRDVVKQEEKIFSEILESQREICEEVKELIEAKRIEITEKRRENLEKVHEKCKDELSKTLEHDVDHCNALFNETKSNRLDYCEERVATSNAREKDFIHVRKEDEEDFTKNQRKFLLHLQELEKILENMKASFMLNAEKLEYNYRILSEREEENVKILSTQKRKLTKLKDSLSASVKKFIDLNLRYKQSNTELTDSYKRLTTQYRELQEKFKHFEKSDIQMYSDLKLMYENNENSLIKQVKTLFHELNQIIPISAGCASVSKKSSNIHDEIYHTVAEEDCKSKASKKRKSKQNKFIVDQIEKILATKLSYLILNGTTTTDTTQNVNQILSSLGLDTSETEKENIFQYINERIGPNLQTGSQKKILSILRHYLAEKKGLEITSSSSQVLPVQDNASEGRELEDHALADIPLNHLLQVDKAMKQYNVILKSLEEVSNQQRKIHSENINLMQNINLEMDGDSVKKLIVPPLSSLLKER